MAEFPALPLFTDAYWADTDHLTDAENGIYLRILMLMWRSPQCRIPNDDSWIARRLRRSPADVAQFVRPVIAEFCRSDGNWISQKRLQKEWNWCFQKREKNRDSANSRWNKGKPENERTTRTHSERSTSELTSGNAPHPTPPHPNKEVKKGRERVGTRLPSDWQPSLEDLAFAKANLESDRIPKTIEKFRDYWLAAAGRNAVKRDWSATWRNWCRTENERNGNGTTRNGSGASSNPRGGSGFASYAVAHARAASEKGS